MRTLFATLADYEATPKSAAPWPSHYSSGTR